MDEVYSTWNLLCGALGGHSSTKVKRIVLRPDDTDEKWPYIRDFPDGTQEILLGKPVAHITHNDIVNEERTKEIAAVLAAWMVFDRFNIVNSRAGLHYVVTPRVYETNKMPALNDIAIAGYWNAKNLGRCKRTFVLAAASLWRPLVAAGLTTSPDPPWETGVPALRELLHWCYEQDASMQGFLPEFKRP